MPSLQQLLQDNQRGATAIYQDALDLFLALPNEKIWEKTYEGLQALMKRFPVMGLFQNLYWDIRGEYSSQVIRSILKNKKAQIQDNRQALYRLGQSLIPKNSTIITISYSSLVMEVLLGGHQGGRVAGVVALRSEPQREGEQLATTLRQVGIQVTIVKDNEFIRVLEQATLVLTGSDLIGRNFFINKTGTAALVVEAEKRDTPVWIVGDYLRYSQFATLPKNCPAPFEPIPYPKKAKLLLEKGLISPKDLLYILKEP